MELLTEQYLTSFVPERFTNDEHYRNGHIHILAPKEGTRILGMHTPEMKKVAKSIAKDGRWKEQLNHWKNHQPLTGAEGLTHEERMIWGLTVNYIKVPLADRLQLIEDFIPAIDNWAICDNFCCNAKWVEKEDKEKIWTFIQSLIGAEEEFRVRVGLILSLAHFLSQDHILRTLDTVASRGFQDSDPYYIRMGAAWLFAEGLCKSYDTTLVYIQNCRLSRWIHNKTIQKARESWRVSDGQKQELKSIVWSDSVNSKAIFK